MVNQKLNGGAWGIRTHSPEGTDLQSAAPLQLRRYAIRFVSLFYCQCSFPDKSGARGGIRTPSAFYSSTLQAAPFSLLDTLAYLVLAGAEGIEPSHMRFGVSATS